MKRSSGFTLIEILVTITIMVILMTLAVASIRSTQVRARDEDRRNDVENITRQLDSLYTKGYSFPYTDPATETEITIDLRGSYPTTLYILDPESRAAIFADLPPLVLVDPSAGNNETIVAATNDVESISGVTPSPGVDFPYVYQPISSTAIPDPEGMSPTTKLCIDYTLQTCRRFNIYYRSETTGQIYMLKSKNR